MQAEVSFQEVDYSAVELGKLDCEQAVAAFESINWAEKIETFDATNAKNEDCCPPHFMVNFDKCYLSLSVYSDGVEAVTSMPAKSFLKKLLGSSDDKLSNVTFEEAPVIIRRAFEDFEALHDSMQS